VSGWTALAIPPDTGSYHKGDTMKKFLFWTIITLIALPEIIILGPIAGLAVILAVFITVGAALTVMQGGA